MVCFNGRFWAGHFRRVFKEQISFFCQTIEKRLLPTFNTIEDEAKQIAQAEWERLGSIVDPEYADEAELAERAEEAGIEYGIAIDGVRQTLVNLCVAALYHLFEQQVLFFHRRQVLHPTEEEDKALMKLSVFKKRVASAGVDVERLPSWAKVDELRVVANTVKHAEGPSADHLRVLRPDLFTHPVLRDDSQGSTASTARVYMPLAGEDIFLTLNDLKEYCSVLQSFWEEFAQSIEACQ